MCSAKLSREREREREREGAEKQGEPRDSVRLSIHRSLSQSSIAREIRGAEIASAPRRTSTRKSASIGFIFLSPPSRCAFSTVLPSRPVPPTRARVLFDRRRAVPRVRGPRRITVSQGNLPDDIHGTFDLAAWLRSRVTARIRQIERARH